MDVDIYFPPADANKPKTDAEKEAEAEKKKDDDDLSEQIFTVPYWDNVICSMQYSEEYYKEGGNLRTGSGDSLLNEEPEHLGLNPTLAQTCGFQYLGMYDTGNYSLVGKGQNEAMGNDDCKGWEEPVPSKSGFLDDGRVGILCNFRRPFGALCTDEEKDEQGNCPGWQ